MEEKIVENKKEDLPSLDLFHSLISIVSLIYLSIYLVCVQSTTHSGSPTTQDPVFALNEQYSTGQSDPYGRHQWDGTVYNRRRQRNSPCTLHCTC